MAMPGPCVPKGAQGKISLGRGRGQGVLKTVIPVSHFSVPTKDTSTAVSKSSMEEAPWNPQKGLKAQVLLSGHSPLRAIGSVSCLNGIEFWEVEPTPEMRFRNRGWQLFGAPSMCWCCNQLRPLFSVRDNFLR